MGSPVSVHRQIDLPYIAFIASFSFPFGAYFEQCLGIDSRNSTLNRLSEIQFRVKKIRENDEVDSKYGFDRYKSPEDKLGFLINMKSCEILDEEKRLIAAVDFYFIQDDNSRFKITMPYHPYFYVKPKKGK